MKKLLSGLLLLLFAVSFDNDFFGGQMRRENKEAVMGCGIVALAIIALALLASLLGCTSAIQEVKVRPNTLLVVNETFDQVAVYGPGQRLGTVMSGRRECMRLPMQSQNIVLQGKPLGGGKIRVSPELDPYRSWVWTIDRFETSDGSSINLVPGPRCR